MATISSIIANRKGTAKHWRVTSVYYVKDENNPEYELWHHGTLMLRWADTPQGVEVQYTGLGWGSVSDQNGMNIAFKVLNVPYYFSRAGGASIDMIPSVV